MSAAASIEDRLAIRELQDRYSDAVFRNDAAAYAAAWTEDAHWEIVGNVADGVGNIIALWQRLMVDMDTVVMYATSGGFDLDGDTGTGRWYIIDVNRTKDGRNLLINSLYDDVYQKDAKGNWRFKSRKLQIMMVSTLQPADIPG